MNLCWATAHDLSGFPPSSCVPHIAESGALSPWLSSTAPRLCQTKFCHNPLGCLSGTQRSKTHVRVLSLARVENEIDILLQENSSNHHHHRQYTSSPRWWSPTSSKLPDRTIIIDISRFKVSDQPKGYPCAVSARWHGCLLVRIGTTYSQADQPPTSLPHGPQLLITALLVNSMPLDRHPSRYIKLHGRYVRDDFHSSISIRAC